MTSEATGTSAVVRWMRFADDATERIGFGTLESEGAAAEIAVHEGDLFAGPEPTGERIPVQSVRVLAPCQPTKVIGLWNNLRPAAEKNGWTAPAEPLYFFKPPSCVVGHEVPVVRPSSYTGRIVYEGELGVVIGRECVDVAVDDVDTVVFGYTCVNDVTALELLHADPSFPQWCRAKGFDTFGPVGPVVARGVEPDELQVRTLVGGKVRQDYQVRDMFFSPRQLVSLISRDMALLPGDVIACGTSTGSLPMRTQVPIEVRIDGIGVLANTLAG